MEMLRRRQLEGMGELSRRGHVQVVCCSGGLDSSFNGAAPTESRDSKDDAPSESGVELPL